MNLKSPVFRTFTPLYGARRGTLLFGGLFGNQPRTQVFVYMLRCDFHTTPYTYNYNTKLGENSLAISGILRISHNENRLEKTWFLDTV